jgi:uncharacterized protein (TIGR02466 family)
MQKVTPFFTSIYFSDLATPLDQIEKSILEFKDANFTTEERSNRHGWQSKPFTQSKLFMSDLMKEIVSEIQLIYTDLGISSTPKIGNYWFNINNRHSYNTSHTHPGCLISAVLYVTAPKDSGALVIERPDDFHKHIVQAAPNENNIARIIQEPKKGLLVMFPSFITHYVEMSKSDESRISIAFNFI